MNCVLLVDFVNLHYYYRRAARSVNSARLSDHLCGSGLFCWLLFFIGEEFFLQVNQKTINRRINPAKENQNSSLIGITSPHDLQSCNVLEGGIESLCPQVFRTSNYNDPIRQKHDRNCCSVCRKIRYKFDVFLTGIRQKSTLLLTLFRKKFFKKLINFLRILDAN